MQNVHANTAILYHINILKELYMPDVALIHLSALIKTNEQGRPVIDICTIYIVY